MDALPCNSAGSFLPGNKCFVAAAGNHSVKVHAADTASHVIPRRDHSSIFAIFNCALIIIAANTASKGIITAQITFFNRQIFYRCCSVKSGKQTCFSVILSIQARNCMSIAVKCSMKQRLIDNPNRNPSIRRLCFGGFPFLPIGQRIHL